MSGNISEVYTVEGVEGFYTYNEQRAKDRAKQKSIGLDCAVQVFKNGEKVMTIGDRRFKIMPTRETVFNSTEAIKKAIEYAKRVKQAVAIYMNGKPYGEIDYKGNLRQI